MIAEISYNHSMTRARHAVDTAFSAGAHAVKLQSSTPDCLTRKFEGPQLWLILRIPWNGRHLYDIYEETCTPLGPIEQSTSHIAILV